MLQCLNDDCLLEIFQYLNLKEQLNLTLAHERFRTLIVEQIWRIKFHKFKSCWDLDELELEMFLRLLAPHITELTLNDEVNEVYFYNAPSLEFSFSLEYPELRKLYLYMWGGFFRNDYLMGIARTSPKLELLVLDSWSATGEYLYNMPNLQILCLTTPELEPIYLKKIFDNQKIIRMRLEGEISAIKKQEFNKVLKTIFPKIMKLRYVEDLLVEPDVLNSSADLFQNLEVLHVLDCERSLGFVCSLHTLRVLHLESSYMQMKDLLKVIDNNVHLNHIYLYGGLWHGAESMLYAGLLFRQRLTAQEVCKISDLRRQQQKNEPCKRLLHIHLYEPKDIQDIVKDHDSNQGHQEPAIRIVQQPWNRLNENFEPERIFLGFMLKWN